jgi:hypothetical protein
MKVVLPKESTSPVSLPMRAEVLSGRRGASSSAAAVPGGAGAALRRRRRQFQEARLETWSVSVVASWDVFFLFFKVRE